MQIVKDSEGFDKRIFPEGYSKINFADFLHLCYLIKNGKYIQNPSDPFAFCVFKIKFIHSLDKKNLKIYEEIFENVKKRISGGEDFIYVYNKHQSFFAEIICCFLLQYRGKHQHSYQKRQLISKL